MEHLMTVTVGVIALNEVSYIGNVLEDLKKQTYPLELMEVVLVDSGSTDGTLEAIENFARENQGFREVKVYHNKKQRQAAGWNVVIKHSTGEVLIRIDAHARIPEDFVEKNIALHKQGEMITGGPRPNIVENSTPWKETLYLAETSMFGSSIAPYRRDSGVEYVKSMFHAAYRRTIFDEVGGFNECLGRTEDNELHYRMRKAGYRFCYSGDIRSYQLIRSSLKGMIKQKYGNGLWIGRTVKVCPDCLSLYHFVPFAFCLGIILTTILLTMGISWPAAIMWGAYWLLAFAMSIRGIIQRKKMYVGDILLPALFFILHVSYGIGTGIGLLMPKIKG